MLKHLAKTARGEESVNAQYTGLNYFIAVLLYEALTEERKVSSPPGELGKEGGPKGREKYEKRNVVGGG